MDWIIEENIKIFSKWFVDNQSRIDELENENKSLKAEIKRLKKPHFSDRYLEKLEKENKELKEEVEVWKNANKILRMHDAKMEYENKKLKADYIKLSKIVETTGGYKASYVNELRDKIAKLEFDIEAWKKWKKAIWL